MAVQVNKTRMVETIKLLPYSRFVLLKALRMYDTKDGEPVGLMPVMIRAKRIYGTQFMLDLFLATEEFIDRWPRYAMLQARLDIVKAMSYNPDQRLREET